MYRGFVQEQRFVASYFELCSVTSCSVRSGQFHEQLCNYKHIKSAFAPWRYLST
jgi:hypothetical protein